MQTNETKYVLYLAVNQVNGKKYVGLTGRKLMARKSRHEQDARANSQQYFHRAIRKYGAESFKWYVVGWSADSEDIKSQEVAHIKFYKSLREELYNMTDGGDGTTNPAPETRVKLVASD
jgi:group I intron endonuclease